MRKILTLFLTMCLVLNTTVGAFAYEKTELITDLEQAIELIESNFLTTDKYGISTISKKASYYIDPFVLEQIKLSMENVNQLIKRNKRTYSSFIAPISIDSLNSSSAEAGIIAYAIQTGDGGVSKTVERWYGKDVYYDATDSNIMAAKFARAAAIGGGITTFFGIGQCYVGAGLAAAVTTDLGVISATCWEGNATNRGTIVKCIACPVSVGGIGFNSFTICYQPVSAKLQ